MAKQATYSFKAFQAEYPNDDACLFKLMEVQHGGTDIVCPECQKRSKFHLMSKRKAFACQHCGHHIHPCANTIFHKSSTKLTHWFFAMYLMTTTRHGVPAKEIQRQTGVTYKTAWRMCHQLRELMAEADDASPLAGHIEMDETVIGGRPRNRLPQGQNKKGHTGPNKTVLFGMVERGGRVRTRVVPNVQMGTLHPHIVENVAKGSKVSTDELKSYGFLPYAGYEHARVAHAKKEFARGDVHVNSIEGFWSRLKVSIKGTHVSVSRQHLWKYAAEFSYRYNMRKTPEQMFERLISSV
ncbi:ISSpo3, transposase [Hyphomicrobium denitrificans 1NES1]|uniref:ISSpo3, transposase n=1 Tax=Hyphomicrobium denitrificans 1NES1 TaxID=670307 RepID=N0B819_9HYPH|nr:IS1595 family transposase [Hyphomicrobium denitrificans]AGK59163.1 ISSpo3, transposase [Hyphomicrobium denitrificans 1NES1]